MNSSAMDSAANPTLKRRDKDFMRLKDSVTTEFKSVKQKLKETETSKCLVRLHNCTQYHLRPVWIDFEGRPIEYQLLPCGSMMEIDTYVSHIWTFKPVDRSGRELKDRDLGLKRVIAVPKEAIQPVLSDCSQVHKFLGTNLDDQIEASTQQDQQAQISGASLICSLCRLFMGSCNHVAIRAPCSHLTGESKLSISDLQLKTKYNYSLSNPYIYACSENTHSNDHPHSRRDIYLVESFYNLRERCFMTLGKVIDDFAGIVDLDLPDSLKRDFVQFVESSKEMKKW